MINQEALNLLNEVRDSRRDMRKIRRKLDTLEVAIWANIFFSFVILCAIAVLIINGSING